MEPRPRAVKAPSPNHQGIPWKVTFFFFWSYYVAPGILVPQPGIEPTSSAFVESQLLDHQEVPKKPFLTTLHKFVTL